MRSNIEKYLQERPYRRNFSNFAEGKTLIALMEENFRESPKSYWERFGYEIGGPVCYGYVKWIIDRIDHDHPDILDIAFVARDGWLLQKIFDILPHRENLRGHYIYAPRTINLLCQDHKVLSSYGQYLSGCGFRDGKIGIVDTITMKFSSQSLITSAAEQATHGFYWVVLKGQEDYGKEFHYSSFQTADYHLIRCWNLMEFIMTSPEPSICAMDGSQPIYRTTTPFEDHRSILFKQIEAGVLEFVRNVCQKGSLPEFSNSFLTKWVNDFLKHPSREDIAAFEGIMCSEREDHSDNIPLDPFGSGSVTLKACKDRLWIFSQKHKWLHSFLHAGNVQFKKLKNRFQENRTLKFDGKDPERFAQLLLQYDVISFDIFDTLVFRKVDKPTDLFYLLEKENGISGFYEKRIRAEENARRNSGKSGGEVNIYDIYCELSRTGSIDINAGVKEEIDLEFSVCHENPAMKELYQILKEKGCRLIAVSDMYIPGSFLQALLEKAGYSELERVFVSCDHGVGKGGGGLQKYVQSEMGDHLRIVHIGDNYSSDVHGSQIAGWEAVWYCKAKI